MKGVNEMFNFNKHKNDKNNCKQSIIDEVLKSQITLFETTLDFTGEVNCKKLNDTLIDYLNVSHQL